MAEPVVSAPSLHFFLRVCKRQEPVLVQAVRPESSVERFDERIVRRLARPGEVQRYGPRISPKVQIARNELRALVDTDRPRMPAADAGSVQRFDDVFGPVAEAWIDHRGDPRERIQDRQNLNFPSRRRLFVHKVHGPGFIRLRRCTTHGVQLRLDAPPWCFVAQLQA